MELLYISTVYKGGVRGLLDGSVLEVDLVSKVSEIQVGMTYHSESFSDDRVHDGQLLEVLVSVVSESTVRVTELLFLLLIKSLSTSSSVMLRHSKFLQKNVHNVGSVSKMEKSPRRSSGGSVLASHKKSNHDVGNVTVRERDTVSVLAALEVFNHVVLMLLKSDVSPSTT